MSLSSLSVIMNIRPIYNRKLRDTFTYKSGTELIQNRI